MEFLIFGHAGAKVLVVPTRDGRFWEFEKLEIVASLTAGYYALPTLIVFGRPAQKAPSSARP